MRGLKIGDWRTKIDAIDTTLLHLLNVRAAFALEVGKLKGEAGMLLRVPAREKEILLRMKKLNPGPLDGEAVEKIYQLILDESIRIQESYGYGTAAVLKNNPAHPGEEQPRTTQARANRRKPSVA
jgi:chorismate mutase-like protein